ncbi:MAG TPA: stage III sporulation protein AF [Clostridia bacterium]|nr:stage III sporulation protein AF [Clostridia bacterium]
MLDFIKQWIMQIVFLVLMITIFNILIPEGKIKKFFILFSGFVMISAVLIPLVNIIKKSPDIDITAAFYSNQINKQDVISSAKNIEKKQTDLIVEQYIIKLNVSAENCIKDIQGVSSVKVDSIVNENYDTNDFGKITKMYVYIGLSTASASGANAPMVTSIPTTNNNMSTTSVKNVEKVQIGQSNINKTTETSNVQIPVKIKDEIVNNLVKAFEVYEKDVILKIN